MNDYTGQLIAGAITILALFVPWALGRYKDNDAREKERDKLRAIIRYWEGFSREALDLASNYRNLINGALQTRLREKDTVDLTVSQEVAGLESDYDRLVKEYRQTGLQPEKEKEKDKGA